MSVWFLIYASRSTCDSTRILIWILVTGDEEVEEVEAEVEAEVGVEVPVE